MTRTQFVLAGGVLIGCAAAVEDAPLTEPSQAAPVIATLELRDRRLTIASTSEGVRYDVADASGTRSELTLEELEAFAPELAEFVRSASARSGLAIDARLGPMLQVEGTAPATSWAGRAPR